MDISLFIFHSINGQYLLDVATDRRLLMLNCIYCTLRIDNWPIDWYTQNEFDFYFIRIFKCIKIYLLFVHMEIKSNAIPFFFSLFSMRKKKCLDRFEGKYGTMHNTQCHRYWYMQMHKLQSNIQSSVRLYFQFLIVIITRYVYVFAIRVSFCNVFVERKKAAEEKKTKKKQRITSVRNVSTVRMKNKAKAESLIH